MASMPVAGVARTATPGAAADVVIRNGRIHTGDARRPAANALGIRHGVIEMVGNEADVAALVGARTQVIDLGGRRAIPGLNDSHTHVIRAGLNYALELRWDGVPSVVEALAMLSEQAARTPPGAWVRVVGGWTATQFAERRGPSLSELNAATGEVPAIVLHLYQSAMLNRAGLEAIGYSRHTPDPPGGQIVRRPDGTPTGLLVAAPAATLLYSTLAKAPRAEGELAALSTRHFLRELNRFGITSAVDAAGGFQSYPEDYATVLELARAELLTVRIAYYLFPQTPGQELDDIRRWVGTVSIGDGDDWLRCNGAGENLIWAAADFENFAQPRPELTDYEAGLETAVRLLAEAGWGFRLHATYDETLARNLTVLERLAAEGVLDGRIRWAFDHAETAGPGSIGRIAALGGIVGVQNRMSFQGEAFAARYGHGAAAAAPPIRAMREAGVRVVAGTDATRVSSYNPWVALAWLITGRTVGGAWLRPPSECLDRATALELWTAGGVALSGEEQRKGRLCEGMLADLAVLSDDFFAVPADEIGGIESVLTVVGGNVVWAAADFEGLDQPLPTIEPEWSPVGRFGGYHRRSSPLPSGVRQAETIADGSAAASEQAAWMARRSGPPARDHPLLQDPCFAD